MGRKAWNGLAPRIVVIDILRVTRKKMREKERKIDGKKKEKKRKEKKERKKEKERKNERKEKTPLGFLKPIRFLSRSVRFW